MEQKLILLGLAVAAMVAIGTALKPEDTSVDCGAVALYGEPNAPELNRIERDLAVYVARHKVIAERFVTCKAMKRGG